MKDEENLGRQRKVKRKKDPGNARPHSCDRTCTGQENSNTRLRSHCEAAAEYIGHV